MTVGLTPYPEIKDSGAEWLGEVPAHWEVLPNRALFDEIKERNFPDEQMLSVTIGKGVIRQAKFLEEKSRKDNSSLDRGNYKIVQPGDVVYNKMRAWQGAIGVSALHGIISPAYVVQRPRGQNQTRYFHHLFRIPSFAKEAERWSYGIASDMWSLRPEDFKLICSCLPPVAEQEVIVRYLDHVDWRVRRLAQTKQKLVALLKEQKQVIIHRAVTRGIDPDVSMKASVVEWLGKVPEHWGLVPVKRNYQIQLGKMLQTSPDNSADIEVPYLKAQHVQWFSVDTSPSQKMWASPSEVGKFGVFPGDLLVCEGGEGGRSGMVQDVPHGFIIQNALHRVRPLDTCLNTYLQYVMSAIATAGWLDAMSNKATIAHFTREKLGSLVMPIPPKPEQAAIVEYLDKTTADIDAAIDRANREIELLDEYRTRLVADVVTGKLDVREAAAALPETDPFAAEDDIDEAGLGEPPMEVGDLDAFRDTVATPSRAEREDRQWP